MRRSRQPVALKNGIPMQGIRPRVLVLILILLAATALRLYRLDVQSFWNDEGNAARAAERSISLILDAARGDIHPPGYYLLLHFWRAVAGETEFALRVLSAWAGILTVAVTCALGHRLGGKAIGLGAALLAALSPLAVYYAQEARMYALLGLLSVSSTYFLYLTTKTWIERGSLGRPRPGPALAYVLTSAAGLYTHYAFPFVLIAHNVFLGLSWLGAGRQRGDRGRIAARWAALQLGALALFLPWLPTALRSVTGWSSAGRGYELGPAIVDVLRALTVGITLETGEAHPPLVATGALLLSGLMPLQRGARPIRARQWPHLLLVATWLVIPIALTFAFDLYKPAYLKFLLAALPPFQLLAARGVENLVALSRHVGGRGRLAARVAEPAVRVALYALLIVPLLPSLHNLYFDSTYYRNDYRQIAADIGGASRPGDAVILNAPNQWEVFTYYYRGQVPVYPLPRARPPRAPAVAAELEQIAARHRRLFVVYWGDAEADPERLVEAWLAGNAYKTADRWYGEVRVALYGAASLPQEPETRLAVRFADQPIALTAVAVGQGPFSPGDIVPTTLFWQADGPIAERYKVFLHLLDSEGRLIAQTDSEPGGGLMPTSIWTPGEIVTDRYGLLLPEDLPGGEYRLVAGLYHLLTGERLVVTTDGAPPSDRVELGTITVAP
jgi:hypothetical protein